MKTYFCQVSVYFTVVLLVSGCMSSNNTKKLDLNIFTITIPNEWNYIQQQGVDSFTGEINGTNVRLNFDCSDMGYSSNLIMTEHDYLTSGGWRYECHFCLPGITYTNASDLDAVKQDEMKAKGINDASLIRIKSFPVEKLVSIHKPLPKEKKIFKNADFIAVFTSNDEVKDVPVSLPSDIKRHNFKVDSTTKYVIKTIWPKMSGKGMTGIYIKDRKTSFAFQMNGRDLSATDERLALAAFKTITFNK